MHKRFIFTCYALYLVCGRKNFISFLQDQVKQFSFIIITSFDMIYFKNDVTMVKLRKTIRHSNLYFSDYYVFWNFTCIKPFRALIVYNWYFYTKCIMVSKFLYPTQFSKYLVLIWICHLLYYPIIQYANSVEIAYQIGLEKINIVHSIAMITKLIQAIIVK